MEYPDFTSPHETPSALSDVLLQHHRAIGLQALQRAKLPIARWDPELVRDEPVLEQTSDMAQYVVLGAAAVTLPEPVFGVGKIQITGFNSSFDMLEHSEINEILPEGESLAPSVALIAEVECPAKVARVALLADDVTETRTASLFVPRDEEPFIVLDTTLDYAINVDAIVRGGEPNGYDFDALEAVRQYADEAEPIKVLSPESVDLILKSVSDAQAGPALESR